MEENVEKEVVAASIEQERAFRMLEAKFISVQNEYERLRGKCTIAEENNQKLKEEVKDREVEKQGVRDELSNVRLELKLKEQQIAMKQSELRSLEQSLQRERSEREVALKLASDQKTRSVVSIQETTDLQIKISELQGALSRKDASISQMEQEKINMQSQNENLQKQIGDMRTSHTEKVDRVQESYMSTFLKLKEAKSAVNTLTVGEKHWRERCEHLEVEKTQLLSSAMEKEDYWRQKVAGFDAEIERLGAMKETLESRLHSKLAACSELEERMGGMKADFDEADAEHNKMVDSLMMLNQKANEEIQRLRNAVEAGGGGAIPRLTGPPVLSSQRRSEYVVEPIESLEKVDLYVKYTDLAEMFNKEKLDAAQKADYIDYIQKEHSRLQDINAELRQKGNMLSEVGIKHKEELEFVKQQCQATEMKIEKLQEELKKETMLRAVAEKTSDDLSGQIRVLLCEVERLKSYGNRAVIPSRSHALSIANSPYRSRLGAVVLADDAVSKHLVDVRNIEDMQKQNKELRESLRMALGEAERKQEDVRRELEAHKGKMQEMYNAKVSDLERQCEDAVQNLEHVQRQRDLYYAAMGGKAALPAPGPSEKDGEEGEELKGRVRELERELKESKATVNKTRGIEEQNKHLHRQMAEACREAAQAQARIEIESGVVKDLEAQVERFRADLNACREELSNERGNAHKWAVKLQQAIAETEAVKGKLSDMNSSIANLEAEKKILGQSQESALSEVQVAVSGRQLAEQKLEAAEKLVREGAVQQQQLEKEISRLTSLKSEKEGELQKALERMGVQLEQTAKETAGLKVEKVEKDKINNELKTAQLRAVQLTTQLTELQKTVESKNAEIEKLQKKVLAGAPQEGRPAALEDSHQVFTLKQNLTAAQEEIERLKAMGDKFKGMVQSSEKCIKDAKDQFDKTLEEKEQALAKAKTDSANIKKIAAKLQTEKRRLEALNTSSASGLQEQKKKLEEEVANVKAELEGARKEKAGADLSITSLRRTVQSLRLEVEEKQKAYTAAEQEKATAHKEANTLTHSLADTKQALDKKQTQFGELEKQLKQVNVRLEETQAEKERIAEQLSKMPASTEVGAATGTTETPAQVGTDSTAQIATLTQQLKDAELAQAPLKAQIKSLEEEVARLGAELAKASEEFKTLQAKNMQLQMNINKQAHVQKQLQDLRSHVDKVCGDLVSERRSKAEVERKLQEQRNENLKLMQEAGKARRTLDSQKEEIGSLKQQMAARASGKSEQGEIVLGGTDQSAGPSLTAPVASTMATGQNSETLLASLRSAAMGVMKAKAPGPEKQTAQTDEPLASSIAQSQDAPKQWGTPPGIVKSVKVRTREESDLLGDDSEADLAMEPEPKKLRTSPPKQPEPVAPSQQQEDAAMDDPVPDYEVDDEDEGEIKENDDSSIEMFDPEDEGTAGLSQDESSKQDVAKVPRQPTHAMVTRRGGRSGMLGGSGQGPDAAIQDPNRAEVEQIEEGSSRRRHPPIVWKRGKPRGRGRGREGGGRHAKDGPK